jgi:hypothetical protein
MTNNKFTEREEVLEAIKNGDYDLEFADDTLKADREVVLAALRNQGGVLEYASEELQNDPELKKLDEG